MPDAIAAAVGSGQVIEALQYDFSQGQVVAVGAAAASSTAFLYAYTAATITATTNCWYSIGATAVAHGAASEYLPAGMKLKVKFAAGQTISVIQDTAAGFLSIAPASNPNFAPLLLDTVPPAAAAYALRKLTNAYAGAAVNVRRSSDNTTQDIGFTSTGDLNVAALNTFIGAGQGFVAIWYDQSGNANNATQATAANQPPITPGLAALNGRPALFGGASENAFGLSVPAAASINNPFASAAGGTVSVVIDLLAFGTGTAQPLFTKTAVQTFMQSGLWNFQQLATTNGLWRLSGSAIAPGPHAFQLSYSSASVANIPTFQLDSIVGGTFTVTQTAGTITSDAANALLIGNGIGLTRGMPAYMGEFILWNTAVPQATIYANQKVYWGTP